MRTMKMNLALAGLFVGVSAAFASNVHKPAKQATQQWKRNSSNVWSTMNLSNSCTLSNRVCKATFDATYDPNTASSYNDAISHAVSIDVPNGFSN
ncbi:hypothetical protein [Mucilaginibacter myungsuensis]